MTAEVSTPIRNYSPRQIAESLGRTPRQVVNWAHQGCPHTMGRRKGKDSPSFNIQEVREWLKSKGLDAGPVATTSAAKFPGELGRHVEEQRSERLATLSGPTDFNDILARVRLAYQDLEACQPTEADPAAWQKYTSSIKMLTAEIRQLEEARAEVDERRGLVIDKSDAQRVITEQSEMFVSDLKNIESELPGYLLSDLDGIIPAESHDAVRRLMAATVQRLVERILLRRAAELDAMAETIEKQADQTVGAVA